MKEAIIEDEELGRLIVRVNLRAKSLVFRTKSDAVYVSVPSGTTMKEVKRAIEDLRSKLLASRQRLNRPLIDLNYKIDAEYFKLFWCPERKSSFWQIPDWDVCRLFVRQMRTLLMRSCRVGYER